jgi:hypothetical protein
MLATMVLTGPTPDVAAELKPETIQAWNRYVAATEARIDRELGASHGFLALDFEPGSDAIRQRLLRGELVVSQMDTDNEAGKGIAAAGGTPQQWRGAVFLPGLRLEELLARLQNPSEAGPHQEDVLALKVLAREPDHVSLFIKMTRKAVVRVTYNTFHDARYRRHGSTRASSRSVATKIAELEDPNTPQEREKPEGHDHGFLWRLNSYWRYEEVPGGVIVECESLTLSRSVPWGFGTLLGPVIRGIARESMSRTLNFLRQSKGYA